jgi:hypothetical protein
MLLATVFLLCPFPQIEGTAKTVAKQIALVSAESATASTIDRTKNSYLSDSLPTAPEAKVKTDAELAAINAVEANVMPVRPAPITGTKMTVERPRETAMQRKVWYALAISGSGAAAFDAWSTRRAISQGYGTEGNPLLRPFSHNGSMYVATQASPLLMDFLGKRMMVSQRKWVRKMWWLPQSAGTGISLYAGVHNTRLVQ